MTLISAVLHTNGDTCLHVCVLRCGYGHMMLECSFSQYVC